jgi:hypothetical protein
MLSIKKMSQKAWKLHANCLYICLTKVILLPSEKKMLFCLVADSPQTIGFSGWDYETIACIISSSRWILPKNSSRRQLILGSFIETTSPNLTNNKLAYLASLHPCIILFVNIVLCKQNKLLKGKSLGYACK